MPAAIGRAASATTDTYYRLLEAYYSMLEKTVDLFLRTNRK
ncbi:MAG: hypothetical protein V7761_08460 [Amylibacter sp.]